MKTETLSLTKSAVLLGISGEKECLPVFGNQAQKLNYYKYHIGNNTARQQQQQTSFMYL